MGNGRASPVLGMLDMIKISFDKLCKKYNESPKLPNEGDPLNVI